MTGALLPLAFFPPEESLPPVFFASAADGDDGVPPDDSLFPGLQAGRESRAPHRMPGRMRVHAPGVEMAAREKDFFIGVMDVLAGMHVHRLLRVTHGPDHV